jgi:apolipoprotein N-acyltransferase
VAWVAFAPLCWSFARARDARQAAWLGLVAGLATNVPAFAWLVYTMRVFGGFPLPIALFFYACLSLFSAAQLVLFALALRRLGPGPLALAAPVVWVSLEFLFPNLFPWRMGNSQLNAPLFMQIGDLTGPYGLSFVLVWFAAALASLAAAPRAARRWGSLVAASSAALVVVAYGAWRWTAVEGEIAAAPRLRVGLVQGNVGIHEKGNAAYFDINVEKYRELSRSLQEEVEVVIWPETVAQWWIAESATAVAASENPFPELRRFLIFGGLAYRYDSGDEALRFNSAFLMGPDGALQGHYNKQILLPFGEYLPLASWLPFIKQLSPHTGDFSAGDELVTLDVPGARFGPLICYEDVPAGAARGMVEAGAQVLLTIFNDAWFGRSMAPYQHEAIAVWRAIENRRFFVRVGNAGATGVVDPLGRVLRRLDLFEVGTIAAEIVPLDLPTFYTRYGDLFAWSVVFAAATWLAAAARSRHRAAPRGG